ncbi:MAG: twin-arginine translocase TatA/TatE family subunit [Blastocatellales bacterium]
MNQFLFLFGGLGPTELIIVLVILLLLFGGSRLPSLAKGLGESIRSFKAGVNEEPEDPKDKTKTA